MMLWSSITDAPVFAAFLFRTWRPQSSITCNSDDLLTRWVYNDSANLPANIQSLALLRHKLGQLHTDV
jgi:hypothetical protein